MDGSCKIALVQQPDLPSIAAIERECFSDPWTLQAFHNELNVNRLALYLAARQNGQVIGYIGSWLIIDEVHITTLAVKKEFRRRGIAKLLLADLTRRTLSMGARYITLEVRPSNKAARKFYEKHGFAVNGRRKLYYSDEDALIMTLPLRRQETEMVCEITPPEIRPGREEEVERPG